MRIQFFLTVSTLLPAIGLAQISNEEDISNDAVVLDPVVVTAARVELPATAIPGAITILDRETIEIQQLISDDLASVLENTVPGFGPSLRKLAGRGETLRGRNPLYLIDNVPQHNALRDGQRDGHVIDLDFVERIEVINGSNAIQGVGATGGVIALITRSPRSTDQWETQTNARFTTSDGFESDSLGYKFSAITGRRLGDFELTMGASLTEQGLQFDGNGDPVGLYATQGDTMDSTTVGLFFKSRWLISGDASLTLMVNDFDLERNGDFRTVVGDRGNGILTTTIAGDPSGLVGDPAQNEVTTTSLTYRHEALFNGTLIAQLYDQSFKALFEGGEFGGFFRLTPDGEPFLDQSQVVSDKNGLKLTWSRPLGSTGSNIAFGLDFFRDDSSQVLARSDREWVPETRFETWAPFVQGNWAATETLTLVGGLRYEDATLEVDDFTTIAAAGSTFVSGGSPGFSETLPNAGIIWRFAQNWNAYASYNEGFTMPDVGRVLRGVSTPGQSVDDLLSIEPIITDNREIGIEYGNGPFTARVAVYDSNAENGSRLLLNDAGIFEIERQKTEIEGIEVSLDYQVNDFWTIGGNYARNEARFDSNDDGSADSDLDGLNISPNRLNGYLQGEFLNNMTLRLQGSYLSSRNFTGPGAPDNANFSSLTLFDAFVSWDSPFGQFALGIDNLLDEQYVTYFSQVETGQRDDTYFAGPGRTLSLGWRAIF